MDRGGASHKTGLARLTGRTVATTFGAMPTTSPLYRFLLRLASGGMRIGALASPALAAADLGRRRSPAAAAAWARDNRDPGRPLVWFHASSVGEGRQAEAVLTALRRLRPDGQIAFTHFSPSAEPLAESIAADFVGYLPYDSPAAVNTVLEALRPDVLVFAKLDLWPELATRAAAQGAAVAIVAATVRPGSGRLRWPARELIRPGYRAVALAVAVSDEDAARVVQLGVPADHVQVAGDSRFDSVLEVPRRTAGDDPLLRFGRGAPTIVAGSTWPADEDVLLRAFARLHVRHPEARLVAVPHQPTPQHLARFEARAAEFGLPAPVRLSGADAPVPILLVDRVGVLAALYGAGSGAYVGGGFGSAGLHSVLEPAAWGIPVVFGPRWQESRDAMLLLEAGGATALAELGMAEPAEQLETVWDEWIRNDAARLAQGIRARRAVEAGSGAAERTAELLRELLPPARQGAAGVPPVTTP